MIAAVVDPSVLVAGFIGDSSASPGRIRSAWREERFTLVISPNLIAEVEDVLSRRKFDRWARDGQGSAYVAIVSAIGATYPDPPTPASEVRDPKDDYLVALARATGTSVIVSVDLDLLEADLPGIAVYRPRAFLELLDRA
ncbi:putative toxin-antitoxin system toxin component, PIN family [Conexibacter sp. S30A1]|uniref:putative toxin-antitoxin system toxin component, PIN family n=1 Tax=Conexibacter sp. S30A1 TaxID=2937800 RepID=UPI00200C79C0|nr:putative toxin-antitoxin system toxin component, PIN family [Conexibacter sp. S30A1]